MELGKPDEFLIGRFSVRKVQHSVGRGGHEKANADE